MEQGAPRGPSGQGPDSAAIARAGSCIPRWLGWAELRLTWLQVGVDYCDPAQSSTPESAAADSPPPAGDRGALRFAERSDLLTHLRRRRTSASHRNPRRSGSCIPRWRGMGGASRYMAASGCRLLRSALKLHPRIGCPDSPPPAGDRGALRFAERSDLLTHLRRRRTSASHRNPRRSGSCVPRGRGWPRGSRGRGWTLVFHPRCVFNPSKIRSPDIVLLSMFR
jgi:hypothetical protein